MAPIEVAVSFALFLVVCISGLILAVGAVDLALTGSTSVSLAGVGDRPCVEVDTWGVGAITAHESDLVQLRTEASAVPRRWDLCLEDASTPQHAAATSIVLGPFLFGVGALLMIRRAVRVARRRGLFTDTTARVVPQLGLYLVLGAVGGSFAVAALRGAVVSAALDGVSWTKQLWAPDLPWILILVGVGVLSFARVLRSAVPLQAEVDATV
ncbi:MAG: DUF2975 domain-containing protein [Nocardioides sp.]|nr:DUF2975 domain-containing protein [Nocardioides sp.]